MTKSRSKLEFNLKFDKISVSLYFDNKITLKLEFNLKLIKLVSS